MLITDLGVDPIGMFLLEHLDLPLYETIGLGEVGEEVMCLMYWHWRNCSKSSVVKGGPFSVFMMLGVCTW